MENPSATVSYDLTDIEQAGELIAGTLNGPKSYYEYRSCPLGDEYALAERFAQAEGVRLRMEVAKDTTDLLRMLNAAEVDLVALELPDTLLKEAGVLSCGARTDSLGQSWAVRGRSPELAEALNRWYQPTLKEAVKKQQKQAFGKQAVRRKVYAPYINRNKGIISAYDDHFRQHAPSIGWDWRLLAALCYQESGFDPHAVSWAGARGLMQIMPGTADILGLPRDKLHEPKDNIAASAKYLRQLSDKFADVHNLDERINFVLAAYNGGFFHIRDAMALTRKYGKNPYRWQDVSYYVLHLSEPHYYRDPVVKHGYMIGNQTYDYVNSIRARWVNYSGGQVMVNSDLHFEPTPATRRNRFSGKHEIRGRSDTIFAGKK